MSKHPTKIGSSWNGKKYRHGPRYVDPEKCSEFKLGPVLSDGSRNVFGRLKRTNRWVRQSKLTPIK